MPTNQPRKNAVHTRNEFQSDPLPKSGRKFFGAYACWHWGEGLQTVLFTWYMSFHLNLSATEIGFFQALVLSPFLIVTIAGGAFTDRFGARFSYTCSTLVFGLVLMLYGGAEALVGYAPWLFFAYCLLAGITSAISNPAIDTFIPDATEKPAQQNALLAATVHNLAKLTGTISGLALPVLHATGGFVLNGVLMITSVLLLRAHRNTAPRAKADMRAVDTRVLRRIKEHYRNCPENLDILLASALLGLVVVPSGYILTPLTLRAKFPELGDWIALVNISGWIGAITVTALATRLSSRILRPGQAALVIWALNGLGMLLLIQVTSFAALCALVLCLGGAKLGKALVYGKYLFNAPEAERGVLISVDQTAFWGLATLGTFLLGASVDLIGLEATIGLASATVLAGALALAFRGHLSAMTPA